MFKKIVLFWFLILILSSCWNSTQESTSTSWLILQDNNNFSISIPASWEVISNENKVLPKPSNWVISLAVTSKKMVNGFANNLLILSSSLNKITNSSDFSILNNIWAEKDYLNYLKLDSKEFIFNNGEKSMLYVFEAKYNFDTPKLKFLQTAYICNQKDAYFFTIALSPLVRDISKYEAFLKTFKCK